MAIGSPYSEKKVKGQVHKVNISYVQQMHYSS